MDDSLLDEIMGIDDTTTQQHYSVDYEIDKETVDKMLNCIRFDDLEEELICSDEEIIGSDDTILSELLCDNILSTDDTATLNTNSMLPNHTSSLEPKVRRPVHELCCLCGIPVDKHTGKLHKFFPCMEYYRCRKCYTFFYQHDHSKKPCFQPFKYIG